MSKFTEAFIGAMDKKSVEPEQRWVGGRFGWANHRFPIKGGISKADVMVQNINKNNELLTILKSKSSAKKG